VSFFTIQIASRPVPFPLTPVINVTHPRSLTVLPPLTFLTSTPKVLLSALTWPAQDVTAYVESHPERWWLTQSWLTIMYDARGGARWIAMDLQLSRRAAGRGTPRARGLAAESGRWDCFPRKPSSQGPQPISGREPVNSGSAPGRRGGDTGFDPDQSSAPLARFSSASRVQLLGPCLAPASRRQPEPLCLVAAGGL
jgi:hypothetical protein